MLNIFIYDSSSTIPIWKLQLSTVSLILYPYWYVIFYPVSTVRLGWDSLEKNAVLNMMSTSAPGPFPVSGNTSFASLFVVGVF